MRTLWKKLAPLLLLALVLAALAWAFWPRPVRVDVQEVGRGSLRVTVDEDGQTRIRERYVVSAPLAGRLSRIALKAGYPVEAGETVLARIEPADPSLLDPRQVAEAEARVRAAEASVARAESDVHRAEAALEFAQTDLANLRGASAQRAVSARELEEAVAAERIRDAELRAARSALDVSRFELEVARAALLRTTGGQQDGEPADGGSIEPFLVRSPISGRVLRVFQESAAIVLPGDPLLEVGDPRELEVVVDVLSRDAVRISPGDRVLLEHWGGENPLEARVRLVEPSGFMKVSSLGVEEQRVNVIIDFAPAPAPPPPPSLGDAYRVEARIVIWEQTDVLLAPNGALFRKGDRWAAYVIDDSGRARPALLELGERNQDYSQVLDGLSAGDTVIMHPGDNVSPGARVEPR